MTMSGPQHWLIYALGGGLGHVTRATALARAANQAGVACTLVANSALLPLISIERELGAGSQVVALDPHIDPTVVAARLENLLINNKPSRLIVDTFPRGLGGELVKLLPSVTCPTVLIHRDLNPQYVQRYQLDEFVAEHFDLVIVPGEEPTLTPTERFCDVPPFFIHDADELLSGTAAREILIGTHISHSDAPLVLILATGHREEIIEMHTIAAALAASCSRSAIIRLATLIEPTTAETRSICVRQWPMLPLLSGVDLIISSGGYNSVNEARAVGVPLIGIARQRLYDRQARRLGIAATTAHLDELIAHVRVLSRRTNNTQPSFQNGAHASVQAIQRQERRQLGDGMLSHEPT